MKSNLEIQALRGWLVLVHGAKNPPTAQEWQRYIEHLQRAPLTIKGQLIHSLGAAPTSSQRAQSIEVGKILFQQRKAQSILPMRTAVMSQSAAVRALATMFNWFFDNTFLGFRLDDWEGAFSHLGVLPEDRDTLRAAVVSMKTRVDGSAESTGAEGHK